MTPFAMEQALKDAGFGDVQAVDGVIYARSNPALPEFTATRVGADWQLAVVWPLRASDAQCAAWTALYPKAPMDTATGETRITMIASPENLPDWAGLVEAMVTKCVQWRRASRQRDEGM